MRNRTELFIDQFPITTNIIYALQIDKKSGDECMMVGEYEDIRHHLETLSSAHRFLNIDTEKQGVTAKSARYGSFPQHYLEATVNFLKWIHAKNSFFHFDRECPNQTIVEAKEFMLERYHNGTLIEKYLILKLCEKYRAYLASKKSIRFDNNDKKKNVLIDKMRDTEERLLVPLSWNLEDRVLLNKKYARLWGGKSPSYYTDNYLSDIYLHDVKILLPRNDLKYTSYYTDDNIFNLLDWYLFNLYNEGTYYSKCKVCGKLFLTNSPDKNTLCSDKCRDVQRKIVKKRFDEKAKHDPIAREVHKVNSHFNNKIRKIKNILTSTDHKYTVEVAKRYIETLEDEKRLYSKIRDKKKLQFDSGAITDMEFLDWLAEQRMDVDEIMKEWEDES